MKNTIDLRVLLLILLLIFVLYKTCDSNIINGSNDSVKIDGIKYNVLKYKVDTLETIKTKIETKKGDDIFYEKIYVDTQYVPKDVDTAAILIDFFSSFEYKDTLKLPDSLGYVFVVDTITKNRIKTRTFTAKVVERIIDSTTILVKAPKNEFYIGPSVSFNKVTLVNSVGGSILFKPAKSNNMYQFNTGMMTTGETTVPYFGGGIYFKINKK